MVPSIFLKSPHNSILTLWSASNGKTVENKFKIQKMNLIWIQIKSTHVTTRSMWVYKMTPAQRNVCTWGVKNGKSGAREVASRLDVCMAGPELLHLWLPGGADVQPAAVPHTAVHLRLQLRQRTTRMHLARWGAENKGFGVRHRGGGFSFSAFWTYNLVPTFINKRGREADNNLSNCNAAIK